MTDDPGNDTESSSDSEDGYISKAVNHMLRMKKIGKTKYNNAVLVEIGETPMRVEIDSGADANVMDEKQYKKLASRTDKLSAIKETTEKIKGIQSELQTRGEFTTVIRNATRGITAKFIVIKGDIESLPLLSRETATQLGMLQMCEEGTFGESNELRIKRLRMEKILEKYKTAFEGIGQIRDQRKNEDIKIHLDIDASARPCAQKPRHVPYYLEEPLKKWLEEGIREEIFEKTPKDEPITWCSPLVVQPSPSS